MKKIILIITAFTLLLVSCSNETVIANKSFVNSLEELNNELLNNNEDINGELEIIVGAGLDYKSSSLEVGIISNSTENSAYYDANISAETLAYLINSIINSKEDNSSMFSLISLYSTGDNVSITEGGNKTNDLLTFDSKTLEKIYLGNSQYLSIDENKANLGNLLNEYKISSELEKVGEDTKFVTTLTLTAEQIVNFIPFINLDTSEYNGEIEIKFYQESETDLITQIDLVLYDYSFTSENEIAYVDIDVTLSFNLPVGGENNE